MFGKNVPHDDAQVACAQCARGFHEFAFAHRQHLRAHQSRIAHPSANRQRQDQIEDAGPEKGDKGDRQQYSGERHEGVHHDDVQHAVGDSAVIAGDGAEDQSQGERGCDHATAHQHRDARAVDDAREDVASQFVGAKPVRSRRAHQSRRQVDLRGILGRNPGRKQSARQKDGDHHEARGGEHVIAGSPAERDQLSGGRHAASW